MADRQHAHDRLKRGWDKIHCQGFKDVCQFCQVWKQPRDDPARVWDYSPPKHGEECNVCYHCLIYYDNTSARANNRCTWYAAHFRIGLRISVLDEDLLLLFFRGARRHIGRGRLACARWRGGLGVADAGLAGVGAHRRLGGVRGAGHRGRREPPPQKKKVSRMRIGFPRVRLRGSAAPFFLG